LSLALATCHHNDLYRGAARRGIAVERVEVTIGAAFLSRQATPPPTCPASEEESGVVRRDLGGHRAAVGAHLLILGADDGAGNVIRVERPCTVGTVLTGDPGPDREAPGYPIPTPVPDPLRPRPSARRALARSATDAPRSRRA